MTTFQQTHIEMVLDRSGSMGSCRKSTIDAVSKYLAEARGDDVMKEADFSLTIFDSQSIDSIRSGAPINITDLTAEDFVPRGGTPLYDAIGRGIDNLDAKVAKAGKAILVIVTDGEENSSRKHSHGSISELIKARQAAGWLVVFLGAGLEAARQGIALGVRAASTASISMDAKGLNNTMRSVHAMNSGYAATQSFEETAAYAQSASFSAADRKLMGDLSGGAGLAALTPGGGAVTSKPSKKPGAGVGGRPQKADAFTDTADAWK